MKLIMENWRRFNEEEEEEEQPDTTEQKLQQLFFNNAVQAMHLAEQVEVDEELMKLMRAALDGAHAIMRFYLEEAPKEHSQPMRGAPRPPEGYMPPDLVGNWMALVNNYKSSLAAVAKYDAGELSQFVDELIVLNDIFMQGPLRSFALGLYDMQGEPKEQEVWQEATAWAGTPQ